jgi:hypothetical protein
MTTVYLAGASREIELCERWMQRLRDAGHVITYDWCANIRRVGDANPREATEEQRREWSATDVLSAAKSEVFWLLMPTKPTVGAWFEFGAVYQTGGPRTLVSGDWRGSIFTALADHRFDKHQDALDWIVRNERRMP